MKKILSLILCFTVITGALVFVSGASDITECNGIKVYDTVITVPGLSNTYKFMQLSDTHYCVVPDNTDAVYYEHSISRSNHFNSYLETDYLDTLQQYYDYAKESGCNAVLMTGDIIDFPSDENIAFLKDAVNNNSDIETMYTLGNHDWTYPDASFGYGAYFSTTQAKTFQPMLYDLCCEEQSGYNSNCAGSYIDFGEVVVIMLNDSEDYFSMTKSYSLLLEALSLNKPAIVCYHVPLYSETLTESVVSMWKSNCIVGSHRGTSLWPLATQYIVSRLESNENIIGLFCGHIHYEHEDLPYDSSFETSEITSNGAVQYACPPGYAGNCRIITVKGTDPDCEHIFTETPTNCASCIVREVISMKCEKCGYEKTKLGEYLEHDFEQRVITEPTCTSAGKGKSVCTVCNYSTSYVIPSKGHLFDSEVIINEPTYLSNGLKKVICSTCNGAEYRPVDKLVQVRGDADLDGIVSTDDILFAKRHLTGLSPFDELSLFSCDTDKNGRVSFADIVYIKFITLGYGYYAD